MRGDVVTNTKCLVCGTTVVPDEDDDNVCDRCEAAAHDTADWCEAMGTELDPQAVQDNSELSPEQAKKLAQWWWQ